MTARYIDEWSARSRPAHPDYERADRSRRRQRHQIGPIGEYARPAECDHPVEARVWPDVRPYVARCHNCGLQMTRAGVWMYA